MKEQYHENNDVPRGPQEIPRGDINPAETAPWPCEALLEGVTGCLRAALGPALLFFLESSCEGMFLLISEAKGGRESERRNTDMREKHRERRSVASGSARTGVKPSTEVCAQTRNGTHSRSVQRTMLRSTEPPGQD